MYDHIKSQLDNMTELSEEQIAELQAAIVAEFESVEGDEPTPQTVDAMTTLADALDTVRGEVKRREAEAQELAARAAEATARVKGEADAEAGQVDEDMAADEAGDMEMPKMDEDEKSEDEAPMAPVEEAPVVETTPDNEAPAEDSEPEKSESEEDEDEKEKESMANEASTSVEEASELSTDDTTIAQSEETTVVDEAVELSVDENATEEVVVEEVTEVAEVVETVEPTEGDATVASAEVVDTEAATAETQNEIAPEEQKEQAPVTASAEESFQAPADRQPVIEVASAPVAITAGADIPGYTAGTTLDSMSDVATAMEKRIHSLRRVNGGDGEQHIVASITTQYPEERTLTSDSESNWNKINGVVGQDALVASGGFAAPLQVKYDIFGLGSTTDRPVRDALPRFQADRGGIRFVTAPRIDGTDYANAVGVWTEAVDLDPQSAVKTSLVATAAAEETAVTDAVTLQLQFGNLMTRAYPELIARHNELGLVQHAREAELNLISKINGASTAVNAHNSGTDATLLGFARDFLVQVRKAAVAYRSRHRLAGNTRLQAIIPAWVYDAMAADLALNMPGDGTLGVGEAEIRGYLAGSGVNLVSSLDLAAFGAQSSGVLAEFPDSFSWYLFAEGTFLFLDGGTLDLGIIRDSSLVGTNDYKMFIETFEGIAKVGIESVKITSAIAVNGVAAALRDTTGGATAAAIEL